ncbi:glycosyltransferase [Enterococcus gallinarum]|uniref:glycosyltransferase n=1 Tax=Enterococcus gallinarum TaxID=1353 RepID=UPI002952BD1B|nr:glycosyltransferase [Enterococcus gallinarum]MDV7785568.1 glycosyltransferase [Enterococcus gallinarum]
MNILFLNNDYKLGGLQRVSSVIGNELSVRNKIYFYSLIDNTNFYGVSNFYCTYPRYNGFFKFKVKAFKSFRIIEQTINNDHEYKPHRYIGHELDKLKNFIVKNNIDRVIVSGPDLISCIPELKKNLKTVNFIAWIHNNYNVYKNKYAKKFWKSFCSGIQQSDKIICLTNEDYKLFKYLNQKVALIYNPLTIDNTENVSLKKKNISFSGRISYEHKGIDYLLKVASKLPEGWTISVAGGGSFREVRRLIKDIKKQGLENKLIYMGALNSEELKKHYKNSSIFILTSRWEGFGLVVPEAMSYGLPIISFEQIGAREILNEGEYGILIENGNVEKLSNSLHQLIENFELREKYSKQSLKRVHCFNIENIINSWYSVLNVDEENE